DRDRSLAQASICHLTTRRRRCWRLLAQDKSAQFAKVPVVITLGDIARPAAKLSIYRLGDKLLDNAPTHIYVTAVLDELALEHAFELRIGSGLRQPLHPAELEDFGTEIECGNADRVRIGRQIAQ